MAYYDALISKWPTISGPTLPQSAVDAMKVAYAVPQPVRPTDAQQFTYPDAYSTWLNALNAWHQSWAGIWNDPTVVARMAHLNAVTVPSGRFVDVPVSSAIDYLAASGDLINIFASTVPAAKVFTLLVTSPSITVFSTSNPSAYVVIKSNLDALVTAGLITQQNEDDLLAMAIAPGDPWWKTAGYASPIGSGDLEAVFIQTGHVLI